jgi:hypothetical protein
VLLDLKKAYDTLDREQTAKILEGYRVEQNIIWFIQQMWEMDTIVINTLVFMEILQSK